MAVFPETRASALRGAACPDDAVRRVAHLVAAYWKPVYKYIRLQWRAPNDEAKDLTQTFFLKALGSGFFAAYDPEKAAFRTFLRLCVDRFVSNQGPANAGDNGTDGGQRNSPVRCRGLLSPGVGPAGIRSRDRCIAV